MKIRNKKTKNEYGYLSSEYKRQIIITLLMFVAPIIIFITGYVMYKTRYNIFAVLGVLALLPPGMNIVNVIMFIKAKKYACDKETYDKTQKLVNGKAMEVKYDYYFTSYDMQYPVIALTVIDDCILGLTKQDKFNHEKFEEHIKTMLSQNNIKVNVIKIFNKEDKFLERIKTYADKDMVPSDKDKNVLHIMGNLSL